MITLNLAHVSLDPNNSRTYRVVGDPYELHRFVYRLCSVGADCGRLLYRMEPVDERQVPSASILVQTDRQALFEQVGQRAEGVHIEAKSAEIELRTHARYRFRARVNPVKSLTSGKPGMRGKRVGVYNPTEQLSWFTDRMESSGMRVLSTDHRRESWLQVRRPGLKGNSSDLTFSSAFFEGVLEVIASEVAEQAVVRGIGPGKGFGFGLLSLAPVG